MQVFAPCAETWSARAVSVCSCRRHDHARCLQYDCRSGSGRQRHRQGRDNRRREGQARILTGIARPDPDRSDAAGYTGDHDRQSVAKTAWQRESRCPPEIAPCQHGGQGGGDGAPWQATRRQQHQSFVGQLPHHRLHTRGMRRGDDALGRQSMLRQNVPGQQAATLACVRRNAAQQTGDAIGGTERPQSLRRRAHRADARRRPRRRRHCRTDRRASPAPSRTPAPPRPRAHRSAPADRRDRAAPASIAARSGSATSWRRCAPSTTSRHHCSRISASGGSDTASRARASS